MTNDANVPRRSVLIGAGMSAAGAILGASISTDSIAAPGRRRARFAVANGEAAAVIVHADAADVEVRYAAQLLSDTIFTSTGIRLSVIAAADDPGTAPDLTRIFVGFVGAGADPQIPADLVGLDEAGFVIAPHGATVTIIGPGSRGTRFGVLDVLEREIGFRMPLAPSTGVVIPSHTTVALPQAKRRENPDFTHRAFSNYSEPIRRPNAYNPSPDNRNYGAVALRSDFRLFVNHNLYRIIPPSVYANPALSTYREDFWPINANGTPRVPVRDSAGVWPTSGWQPRFTATGIAEVAAQRLINLVNSSPIELMSSLSINDRRGFSDDDLDRTTLTAAGVYSASENYYQFVNEVVERFALVHPNTTVQVLAYDEVIEPPSFPLHQNVIPFVTWDNGFAAFSDRAQMQADLIARWLSVSSHLGWYDYRYGRGYCIPRGDSRIAIAAMRSAHQAGVRYSHAEVYGDGGILSKPYVWARTQWNINADYETERADFADAAVGPAAASPLVAYEQLWEDLWENTIAQSGWYKMSARMIYGAYTEPDYLTHVPEDTVVTARGYMNQIVALASTTQEQSRAELLHRVHAFHEASALSYPRPVPTPTTTGEAIALVNKWATDVDRNLNLAAQRPELHRLAYENSTVFPGIYSGPTLSGRGGLWSGWNGSAIFALGDYLRTHEPQAGPTRTRIAEILAATPSASVEKFFGTALRISDGHVVQLGTNTSFDDSTISPWQVDTTRAYPGGATVQLSSTTTVDGIQSLLVPLGGGTGGIHQAVAVAGGATVRTSIRYYTPSADSLADTVLRLTWSLTNSSGSTLPQMTGSNEFIRDTQGQWAELSVAHVLPDTAASLALFISIRGNNFSRGSLFLDAARIEQATL